jgi:P27 family predicted phage terminase small subunit
MGKIAKNKKNRCPQYLSKESRKLWHELLTEYQIEDSAGLKILLTALEAFDRAKASREKIDLDGMVIQGPAGRMIAHPLCTVERDARAQFLAALKQLNLDVEGLKDIGRPPEN